MTSAVAVNKKKSAGNYSAERRGGIDTASQLSVQVHVGLQGWRINTKLC